MAEFIVHGPYDIPVTKGSRGGRIITKENGKAFFEEQSHIALDIGVYVIALRNRGTVPIYVGKTGRSFDKEVFNGDNCGKYSKSILGANGTPVAFFVSHAPTQGPKNRKQIDEVESFLIQAGLVRNPALLNDKKTKVESWRIRGVVRAKQGEGTRTDAVAFRKCMDV